MIPTEHLRASSKINSLGEIDQETRGKVNGWTFGHDSCHGDNKAVMVRLRMGAGETRCLGSLVEGRRVT